MEKTLQLREEKWILIYNWEPRWKKFSRIFEFSSRNIYRFKIFHLSNMPKVSFEKKKHFIQVIFVQMMHAVLATKKC